MAIHLLGTVNYFGLAMGCVCLLIYLNWSSSSVDTWIFFNRRDTVKDDKVAQVSMHIVYF